MKNKSYTVILLSESKYRVIASVLSLVLTTVGTQAYAKEWGAEPLTEKYRPDRAWIDRFAATPDVVARGSIADAIESCDDIVGERSYCVVEIGDESNGLPLEIYRSRTKLVGKPGMDPLGTDQNDIFIYIGDHTKQVVIEGLHLEGHSAGYDEIHGIFVEGKKISHILIRNNYIHHFDSDENAHGIAVYGTAKAGFNGIHNVIIEGNEVHSMRTGSSESIVVNGNVSHWEIIYNDVYDINNIAIDAIGGEGTAGTRRKRGRILPSRIDVARYGFIEDNFVENMSTLDNPAYDNEESWAAAIYIDGARHVKITDNVVVNASWGYELGAENCVAARHITMTGNSAIGSTFGDLLLGGYTETGFRTDRNINCDPNNSEDDDEGHGYVNHLTVKENAFDSTGTLEDPVTLQFRTTHAIVAEPGVAPVNEQGNGSARGDENAVRIVE